MKTYTFHVIGMHCQACVLLTESELSDVPGVVKVISSFEKLTVEVTGDFGDSTVEDIARDLSVALKPHGYALSLEKQPIDKLRARTLGEFKIAIPIALGFVALFILLQKLGIVNLITATRVNYGTAFAIGLIASVSTCMAVVGGLVLSMSANFAKEGDKLKPQLLFHVGRLVSFLILGGVIGAIGSAFQLGTRGIFTLGIVLGLVMLVLGINLLDVFGWTKKLQPTMPSFIGKRAHGLKNINHTLTPFVVGVATFFLPCGFTQSMQLYALTTGSFLHGALLMLSFALGTLPILALISFSSSGLKDKARSGIFFKTAGLVVIFFALFNILNSLVAAGFIPPLFNF